MHRWVRLREHVYVCRICGTGRVNAEAPGGWATTYHTPDGRSSVELHVPPCRPGQKTSAVLHKYAELIASGGVPKHAD